MHIPVIGVAGTAKNTGKTTTISSLLAEAEKNQLTIAITTIGYDGEEIDNITELPKPRIYLHKNSYAATAEKCLRVSTAELSIRKRTQIRTPLGRILIVKIKKPGYVVLAGPQTRSSLKKVIDIFKQLGCELILVDGALNRMVPMIVTDGIVLATGAAKNTDPEILAREVGGIFRLFQLPQIQVPGEVKEAQEIICLGRGINKKLATSSLLTEEQVSEIVNLYKKGANLCYIPGAINQEVFFKLLSVKKIDWKSKRIVIHDALRLIISGPPEKTAAVLKTSNYLEEQVGVLNRVALKAITINPFYPEYRVEREDYTSAYVDNWRLKEAIKAEVKVPVFNVVEEGGHQLFRLLIQ